MASYILTSQEITIDIDNNLRAFFKGLQLHLQMIRKFQKEHRSALGFIALKMGQRERTKKHAMMGIKKKESIEYTSVSHRDM